MSNIVMDSICEDISLVLVRLGGCGLSVVSVASGGGVCLMGKEGVAVEVVPLLVSSVSPALSNELPCLGSLLPILLLERRYPIE